MLPSLIGNLFTSQLLNSNQIHKGSTALRMNRMESFSKSFRHMEGNLGMHQEAYDGCLRPQHHEARILERYGSRSLDRTA